MSVSTNSYLTGVATGVSSASAVNLPLLTNVSATGAGSSFVWPGGEGTFTATGTFGGTSAILQFQVPVSLGGDGTAWTPAGPQTTLALGGSGTFNYPNGYLIRAFLSGGSPSGMYCTANS